MVAEKGIRKLKRKEPEGGKGAENINVDTVKDGAKTTMSIAFRGLGDTSGPPEEEKHAEVPVEED